METYLAHNGILGIKWGIRHYQNEDGTLTSAGKRRITSLEGKKESQKLRYDIASKKYDGEVAKYGSKAADFRSQASKMRYDAYYGLIGSKKSRVKKLEKAEKLSAKADNLMANAAKYKGLMDKAQAKIAKYDRKITEIDPSKVSAGRDYVDKLLKES